MFQVLRYNPNREETYIEISNLIEFAPQKFKNEMKDEFLKDIYTIEGIREDYLKKSGLK